MSTQRTRLQKRGMLCMKRIACIYTAQGGLDKVNTFMDNVLTVLRGVSLTVVTIAIMWAGYKYLFKHADLAEAGKILAGGLLIGGAAELAAYLLA